MPVLQRFFFGMNKKTMPGPSAFIQFAWDTYCPAARRCQHVGETVVACGLVVEQRTRHQITGEPMKFLTLAD
jgi:hypothetical protein